MPSENRLTTILNWKMPMSVQEFKHGLLGEKVANLLLAPTPLPPQTQAKFQFLYLRITSYQSFLRSSEILVKKKISQCNNFGLKKISQFKKNLFPKQPSSSVSNFRWKSEQTKSSAEPYAIKQLFIAKFSSMCKIHRFALFKLIQVLNVQGLIWKSIEIIQIRFINKLIFLYLFSNELT